jgi:uncharacterized protein DUF6798
VRKPEWIQDARLHAAILAAAFAVFTGLHWVGRLPEWIPFNTDWAWQVPLADRLADPSLFSKDVMLLSTEAAYPRLAVRIFASLLRLFGGVRTASWVWSAACLAGFVAGQYVLGRKACGSPIGGLALAMVSIRPRTLPAFAILGVRLGEFHSDSLGLAALPWVLGWILDARDAADFAVAGSAAGLAALVSPWPMLHLVLVASIGLAWRDGREGSRRIGALGGAFLLFLICSTPLVRRGAADPPDPALLAGRMEELFGLGSRESWLHLGGGLLLPAAWAAAAGARFWRSDRREARLLRLALPGALLFFLSAPLGRWWPLYISTLSWRSSYLVVELLLIAGAAGVAWGRWPALILFAGNLAVTDLASPMFRVDASAGQTIEAAPDACRPSFLELSAWAKATTPKDALFLVPPNLGHFRVYAERSIVVSDHDWAVSHYAGSTYRAWLERMAAVEAAYRGEKPGLAETARRYGADWVVLRAGGAPGRPTPVYANRCYEVQRP